MEAEMNRRLAITGMTAMALIFSAHSWAQQRTLKDTLMGAWEMTSVIDEYEDGKKNNPWGAGMKGMLVFDSKGWFSQMIIGEKQESMKSPDPRRPDALAVAYYGTYSVNEADKSVSLKLIRAANSARDGSEQKLIIKASTADTLTLIGSPRKDQQGTFSPQLQLKRAQ
jgi:hypothetical protein